MSYTPEFKLEPRNGAVALWVTMPNGEWFNIWDLYENEITSDVLSAVKSAFYRGVEAQRKATEKAAIKTEILAGWIDKRVNKNE